MTYRALLKYRSLCESDADIDVFNALLPLYCLGQQKLMDLIRNKSGNGLPRYEDAKYFFINYLRESYVEPILGQFHKNYKAISERESGDLQRWYKGQIIEEGSFTLQNFRPLLRAQALMFLKDRYRAFCNKEFSKYYMTYMGILKQQKESLSFLLVIQEIQANDDYRKHIHCFDYPKALAFTQGVLSTEMMKEILTLEMRRQAWRYFDTNLKAEKQFLMSSYSPLKSVAKLFRLGDLGSGSSTALLANSLWEKVSPVDIYAALKVLSKSKNQLERNMTVNVLAAFLNNRVWLKKYSGWTAEDARQFLRKR
jgi:hypothetical protein